MINNRNEKLLQSFGSHLRKIRRRKKVSQEQLAFAAEISISQISRIERGLINPTLSTIFSLASALDMDMKELCNFVVET